MRLKAFPLGARYTGLSQYPHERAYADVATMRVRDGYFESVSTHVFMASTGVWPIETQMSQVANEVSSADRTYRWH